MTWARLDDSFYDHPKVLTALEKDPASIGLHVRAISYIAKHSGDGQLADRALSALMPVRLDRDRAVKALTDAGLWHRNGAGFIIHHYLDYNLSKAEIAERRRRDRERKAAA